MSTSLKNNYVLIIGLLCFITMTARVWNKTRAVIWSDAEGYYLYNPTVFILGDLAKMPAESLPMSKTESGANFNKYTCGVALLQMPFFLATRAFCLIADQEPNEIFSMHYGRSVAVSGYFYVFAGLYFLDKAMRRKYRFWARLITILTVWAGTNLFHYTTKEPGMSHAYSFFLFAMVVWMVPRFYERPGWLKAAALGLLAGWIVLIRPTSILILVFVFAYDCNSLDALWQRLRWWLRQPALIVTAALAALCIWLPQMYYWYTMTGKYFVYSYEGESFLYWRNPKIAAVLFDTQNGLFLFSPMVFFMIAAMWFYGKDTRAQVISLSTIFVLSTVMFASWWAWHFGGAFGHRSYIEFYALYALPFGVLVERVLAVRFLAIKIILGLLWLALCAYSVKMSYLYNEFGGPWDGPEWRWNWDGMFQIWEHLFELRRG